MSLRCTTSSRWRKQNRTSVLARLCWLLFPRLPRVFALSMWAVFEKAASSVRPRRLCPLTSHGSFHLSMPPLFCGSRGEGHHSGKACWDTWTVSRSPAGARSPCGVWRDVLLGDAGSCLSAAWKPTYGPLVLVRTRQDVFQHLHFNSSSVFKWRTTAR